MNDFSNIKVGDRVFLDSQNGIGIFTVTKTTNKQIVIMRGFNDNKYECRYWKKNGRAVGEGSYVHDCIYILTPELIERVELRKLSKRANELNELRNSLGIPQSKDGLLKFIAALESLIVLK